MKLRILLFFLSFLLLSSAQADLFLRTSFFYDPDAYNNGSGTSSSGATLTGKETNKTTLTYRIDALNVLPSGFMFGYALGSMAVTEEVTEGSSTTENSSTVSFHGPGIGYRWSFWSISFFYYLGARETREETTSTGTNEYNYRDSSGYEFNVGVTFPLGRRVRIGARLARRQLTQKEVGVKASGASTETAYTLSEANSRTTNQILVALDFVFF